MLCAFQSNPLCLPPVIGVGVVCGRGRNPTLRTAVPEHQLDAQARRQPELRFVGVITQLHSIKSKNWVNTRPKTVHIEAVHLEPDQELLSSGKARLHGRVRGWPILDGTHCDLRAYSVSQYRGKGSNRNKARWHGHWFRLRPHYERRRQRC